MESKYGRILLNGFITLLITGYYVSAQAASKPSGGGGGIKAGAAAVSGVSGNKTASASTSKPSAPKPSTAKAPSAITSGAKATGGVSATVSRSKTANTSSAIKSGAAAVSGSASNSNSALRSAAGTSSVVSGSRSTGSVSSAARSAISAIPGVGSGRAAAVPLQQRIQTRPALFIPAIVRNNNTSTGHLRVYTGGKSALVRITGVHASHQNVMDVVTFELNTYLRMINPDIEDIYFETEITQPNGVKLRSSTVYGDYQLYFDPYKGGRRFNQATMDEGFFISDRLSFGGR